ncbi:hypothetical protein Sru01_50180 [Sphaerisporangium rufum]|uniref:histidine kinase n=1 Tax=Sphaerisporangium rufum TaxID=1381558 RepID=A0A919V0G0_9ACTN|nr:histidine kinase [Sphaerisporangium rufum]GII80036.1 hypothetical protein Sru01_50180 [Sphaerisporangium rufum]
MTQGDTPVSARSPAAPPAGRRARIIDVLLALGTWALYLAAAFAQDRMSAGSRSAVLVLCFTVSSTALLWRRGRPLAVVAVTVACDCLVVALTGWKGYAFQAMIAFYSAGRYGRPRAAWAAAWAAAVFYTAVAAVIALFTGPPMRDTGSLGWFVPLLLVGGGRLLLLREENARRKQTALAEEIVRTERRRIARELHDVVAHNISTMQVLIGAARTTMTRDTGTAEAALRDAENAGRAALAEMRQLLHVLRADESTGPGGTAGDGGGVPAHRTADLPELAGRARAAGQRVTLEVTGENRPLPTAVDHAVYRVVQESLTNARKHAPGAAVRVRIDHRPAEIEVEVVDGGSARRDGVPAPGGSTRGHPAGGAMPDATADRATPGGAAADGIAARGNVRPAPDVTARGNVPAGPAPDVTAPRNIPTGPGPGPGPGLAARGNGSAPGDARPGDLTPGAFGPGHIEPGGSGPGGFGLGGFGLGGMRERVTLCGGRLAAGPVPGGGFRVHARIPLPGDPPPGAVATSPAGPEPGTAEPVTIEPVAAEQVMSEPAAGEPAASEPVRRQDER